MTTYLLDTNACIGLINGSEANVRRRFQRAVARDSVILVSSIVAFELWYGVAMRQRKDSNTQRLEAFSQAPSNGRCSMRHTDAQPEPFALNSRRSGNRSVRMMCSWPVKRAGTARRS
jgi:predicted nucleic acid-binding protein